MNACPALFCPETLPLAQDCRALLFFADQARYYRPLAAEPLPPELAALAENRLCTGYSPVDLGTHQGRFQQLAGELKKNGGEFYGGLLGTFSAPFRQRPDEAAVWSLIAGMRQKNEQATADQELETTWNALLLLKLAELHQAEEREIAAQLEELSSKEAELFGELTGDEELAAPFVSPVAADSEPVRQFNQERLLRAWGQLFLRDTVENLPLLLVTTRAETAMLLLDIAGGRGDGVPVPILTLPMPLAAADSFVAHRLAWQQAASSLLAEIHGTLNTFATAGTLDTDRLRLLQDKWQQALESGQPRKHLTITALPNVSLAELFGRLTKTTTNKKGHGAYAHGLLALLD